MFGEMVVGNGINVNIPMYGLEVIMLRKDRVKRGKMATGARFAAAGFIARDFGHSICMILIT